MKKYYEILGLEPGADEKSIKRAYFRLVRQYSPETDPEMFQKIREAYEGLTEKDRNEDTLEVKIEVPTQGTEGYYSSIVQKHLQSGDYKRASEFAGLANELFPDEDFFVYALYISQRRLGKTGKSAKFIGILSDRHPGDKVFARMYADALLTRGYHKKALSIYERAYELGSDDIHFFMNFALCCIYNRRHADALEHLRSFIAPDYKWGADRMEEALAVFDMALDCSAHCSDEEMVTILDRYGDFLESNKRALRGYYFYIADRLFEGEKSGHFGFKTIQYVRRIFDIARNNCEKEKAKDLEYPWVSMQYSLVENDCRLGEIFEQAAMMVPDAHALNFVFVLDLDNRLINYLRDGIKLVMLREQDELMEKEEILKIDHPELYAFLGDVYDALRSEDGGENYRIELERKHYSQMRMYGNSAYFDHYPEELEKHQGKRISSMDPTEVYVRETPKIGRNDPCPCGSGKKYKKCCGR